MKRVETASSIEEHLLMAAAILGFDPRHEGCVVECGCYKGGSTVNLSLACGLAGRSLKVFDSFSGLPEPTDVRANFLPADSVVHEYEAGMYTGSLAEVQDNIRRNGNPDVCSFHKGWFDDTLAGFSESCVVAFIDVDLRQSLETCVKALWPNLVADGYLFVHEARHREITELFFDREWWRRELDDDPPGLAGAMWGVGLQPSARGWYSFLGYARKTDHASVHRQLG